MAKGRMQNRHGTYPSGKAAYYRTASGEPVRLANAEEMLKIYRINEETVPESVDWFDRKGNFYIPETFEGFTDNVPEIVFSDLDQSLWLKNFTSPTPSGSTNYFWVKMLTSDDV